MDRIVRFFSGGTVNESGEFTSMRKDVAIFGSPPSYEDLIARVNQMFKVGHEQEKLTLRARFDAGDKRAHYVLMPIRKEDDWLIYKELVQGSQVRCCEVFVDVCGRGVDIDNLDEYGDDNPIEHLTQEEIHGCNEDEDGEDDDLSDDGVEVEDEEASGDEGDFDTCRVANNFDDDTFENEEVDDDDMSESSDEDPFDDCVGGCEQENDVREVPLVQPTPVVQQARFVEPISVRQPPPVVQEPVEQTVREPVTNVEPTPGARTEEVVEERVEVEETGRQDMSTLSGFRLTPLTPAELRQLEAVHVHVPAVPIFHSIPSKAYCDSGLRLGYIEPDSSEELIAKGMIFESIEELKFFLRDYSVRHHRPYDVVHSSVKLRIFPRCPSS
ncbi:unnamed protein product [Urochloa decumbens]|uniref:Transposase MuDR plant domain-containing protein n=1 Tax=Urochloa decumbens TaxID=240449 RepID=A0ABC9EDV3_9POAL